MYREACFKKNDLYKWAKHGFCDYLRAWIGKTIHEVETPGLSGKEKVPGTVVSKEGHAESLLIVKGPITIDFLGKGETINTACYCRLLGQYFTLFIEWLVCNRYY